MTRHLVQRLEVLLRKDVRLTLTDNTRALVRTQRRAWGYRLRLHRMFATADPAVLAALAMVVAGREVPPVCEEKLRSFLRRTRRRIREGRLRPRSGDPICPYGAHHDLDEIRASLSRRYFGGRIHIPITWSRAVRSRRARRTIWLGQYCFERRVILIHPCLDQRFVPRYALENVIFHEMLHHELGESVVGGRRMIHTPEFRRQERRYRKFEQAERWKDRHIDRLLRYKP